MRLPASSLLGLTLALAGTASAAAPPAPTARIDVLGDPLPEDAVARLGSGRFRLEGPRERTATLSPDGKLIASFDPSAEKPCVELIDAKTGRRTRSFPSEVCRELRFSPDGKV